MIGDCINYHYLAVTNLSGLLQGNSSNLSKSKKVNKVEKFICDIEDKKKHWIMA